MVSKRLQKSFYYACACALLLVLPAAHGSRQLQWLDQDEGLSEEWRRNLELTEEDSDTSKDNCSDIYSFPELLYNDTCQFVESECGNIYELFNYLGFATCSLGGKAGGFIFLIIWLCYLLLILSSTVDNFFVPVLQLLADKLHLPASIAGMTLLALGNGAPDIFVAFSALQDDNLPLMLGALLGAGLFITSVILGTVMLVTGTKSYNINPLNFMRDVIAYIVVLAIIVAVAYDGKVTLSEAICFPMLYILYVAIVVFFTFLSKWIAKRREDKINQNNVFFGKDEDEVIIKRSNEGSLGKSDSSDESVESEKEPEEEKAESVILPPLTQPKKVELVGLTIPKGKIKKVTYILEFPFSVLRWLTIPPCSHDGQWSIFHFLFAIFSPIPMSLLLLLAATDSWSGFTSSVGNSPFPVCILVLLCVSPLCVVLFFTLSRKKPPHWIMQIVLMIGAFVMSIAWLYLIANEVVDVLQAMGLLLQISTAILGLTVLAIGNSVADWVADTIVASRGKPEMAIASCFGAPLITHVLGLSFALLAKLVENGGQPYAVGIKTPGFAHVKLAWIFLGIVLLGSAVIFPLFRFKPPKEYSLVLIYVYVVFMLFSVLMETDTLPIKLL